MEKLYKAIDGKIYRSKLECAENDLRTVCDILFHHIKGDLVGKGLIFEEASYDIIYDTVRSYRQLLGKTILDYEDGWQGDTIYLTEDKNNLDKVEVYK